MRRILITCLLCAVALALAGCGNKGPLVRASANSANQAPPAPAMSTSTASPASSTGSTY